MPELPEVESIRKQLEKYIVGHKIQKVEVRWRKSLPDNEKRLVGGKILKIHRFGKALSIDLSNGYSAVIHIKMTGQLIYRGPNLKKGKTLSRKVVDGVPGKHTHVIFYLDREGVLYYNDVRKFGWIKVVRTLDVENIDFIKRLGPEPPVTGGSAGNSLLTLVKFKETTASTKRANKILLMDQTKIGGVGNIYANDALWLSKIHPEKAANELSNKEAEKLYSAIINVLKEGLKRGGASEISFVTPDGKEGSYQEKFLAYGRKDEPCDRCHKAKFEKSMLGGRGTFYCPHCQKK